MLRRAGRARASGTAEGRECRVDLCDGRRQGRSYDGSRSRSILMHGEKRGLVMEEGFGYPWDHPCNPWPRSDGAARPGPSALAAAGGAAVLHVNERCPPCRKPDHGTPSAAPAAGGGGGGGGGAAAAARPLLLLLVVLLLLLPKYYYYTVQGASGDTAATSISLAPGQPQRSTIRSHVRPLGPQSSDIRRVPLLNDAGGRPGRSQRPPRWTMLHARHLPPSCLVFRLASASASDDSCRAGWVPLL